MNSSVRDRRSPVFAEQGNSSRETSLTRKGDILWDSVHLTIRFRSFSSMSFSLSERRPWPTGSEHKITTPQEETTRRLLGRGGRTNSSSPLPVLPLSPSSEIAMDGLFPLLPALVPMISSPVRPGAEPCRGEGSSPGDRQDSATASPVVSRHRSPLSPAEGDRVVFPDPSLLGLSGERRPEIGAFEKLRRPS